MRQVIHLAHNGEARHLLTGWHYWRIARHTICHSLANGDWLDAWILLRYQRGFIEPLPECWLRFD